MTESRLPTDTASFRGQTWQTKWLVVSGVFLAVWYSIRFIDREWLLQWPLILVLAATGLVPQLFLLLFPLLTRDKDTSSRIEIPGIRRCVIEFAIAIPIVVVTLSAVGGLNYLVSQIQPGKTLTPDALKGMASLPTRILYPLLLFAFTFAPVAEEVFFRGFLYNALRRRMPTVAAGLLQSLVFGFCHFFGTIHAVMAVALGLVITIAYEWRKTLISPIFVHALINFVSAIGIWAMMEDVANRPTLGVAGDPHGTECIIQEVFPNSAAAEAGIAMDDRIVAVDGQPIAGFSTLKATVATRAPGETVTFTIERDGETLEVDVTLKRRADTAQPP